MDKKFIMNIQGKEFVLFEGLLNQFHADGGKSIKTEILSTAPFIVQATAEGEKGTFQGIGDASDENVNSMIAKHKIRMAETRAIARALRWYNNIGMCSADELGGDVITKPKGPNGEVYNCSVCGSEISEKVLKYSKDHYGVVLCMECQKKQTEIEARIEK